MQRVFGFVSSRHGECMKLDRLIKKLWRRFLRRITEYYIQTSQSIYLYMYSVGWFFDNNRAAGSKAVTGRRSNCRLTNGKIPEPESYHVSMETLGAEHSNLGLECSLEGRGSRAIMSFLGRSSALPRMDLLRLQQRPRRSTLLFLALYPFVHSRCLPRTMYFQETSSAHLQHHHRLCAMSYAGGGISKLGCLRIDLFLIVAFPAKQSRHVPIQPEMPSAGCNQVDARRREKSCRIAFWSPSKSCPASVARQVCLWPPTWTADSIRESKIASCLLW
jgi:hypothetical protein